MSAVLRSPVEELAEYSVPYSHKVCRVAVGGKPLSQVPEKDCVLGVSAQHKVLSTERPG